MTKGWPPLPEAWATRSPPQPDPTPRPVVRNDAQHMSLRWGQAERPQLFGEEPVAK